MNAQASGPQAPVMTSAQMCEVIRSTKSGDRLKIVFANKTFNGDLKGRLERILAMNGQLVNFDEMSTFSLIAVADSGKWEGSRAYTIIALIDFNPEYFISRTIGREMFESVSRVS